MQQIVTKFGGTSVSSKETWENILEITRGHIHRGLQPIIVCSAMTSISNKLEQAIEAALSGQHQSIYQEIETRHLAFAETLGVPQDCVRPQLKQLNDWLTGIALLKQAPPKIRAQILSLGEVMMTHLGHAFLNKNGVSCKWFDVREGLISTPIPSATEEINYLAACCESDFDPDLQKYFAESDAQAVITQGFFASNPQCETVLLGRGGSDTSAALIAAKIQAVCCEIWTDVPGIYTGNPHQIPQARLLRLLSYDEAQEIATMGAKVLQPNCIPPVRSSNIPMAVKFTRKPEHPGTLINRESDELAPPIKSIQVKHSIILISIDTLNMWQQVGFLADVFVAFKNRGFSVDLLSSSEFNVTVSLDSNAKLRDRQALEQLIKDLNCFGRAKLIEPCSAVSLVGHPIRTVLPYLGPTLEVFEDKKVYLMSLASNDLNLTFVVDESQAEKLCQKLHNLLIEDNPQSISYSKTWAEEFGQAERRTAPWWEVKREQLLDLAPNYSPCYVYDRETVQKRTDELAGLKAIDQIFYAVKANPNADLLKILYEKNIGFECVSAEELRFILKLFPHIRRDRLLFTPNFAARTEYELAIEIGCYLTIDSLYPLENWPDLLQNQKLFLRVDAGSGAGHHKFVSTTGNESKFGIHKADLEKVCTLVKQLNCLVYGLHSHSGSGILTPELWEDTATMLADMREQFPKIEVLNLGGGLGIAEKPGQSPLNLQLLDESLLAIKSRFPDIAFWLEPGRYFVAESGVILARVTQCKEKGRVQFIGVETGMNSLIRPALYGAYHEIVNLTRLHEKREICANIVGPICESSDTLGYDRRMPHTQENDIILIANTGAYGHCMGSTYNLRPIATELMLD